MEGGVLVRPFSCPISPCCTSNFRSEPFSDKRNVVAIAPCSEVKVTDWTPAKSIGISSKKQQKDFLVVSMAS